MKQLHPEIEIYCGKFTGVKPLINKGIQTVVALDKSIGKEVERTEIKRHVFHLDDPYRGGKITPPQLEEIADTILTLPRPLFFHCKMGVHRTGLVRKKVLRLINLQQIRD